MEKFLRIGIITKAHGLKGEVKVYSTTDTPERFKQVKEVLLKTPKGDIKTEIESVKFVSNVPVVKFSAFNDVEEVKDLHNTEIYIDRKYSQELEEGEYYIADLIGCTVYADEDLGAYPKLRTEGRRLGTVKDVLQTGANDVYIVDTEVPDKKDPLRNIEVLLPVIPQCILKVDIEKEEIYAHIMEGLI